MASSRTRIAFDARSKTATSFSPAVSTAPYRDAPYGDAPYGDATLAAAARHVPARHSRIVSRARQRIAPYRGRVVCPIRNWSIDRAHCRPSRMAHTTRDWPRRMSPAANRPSREVL